jgi:hypothetical protein
MRGRNQKSLIYFNECDEEMPKGEDDPEEAGIRLVEEDDDDEEKVKDNRTADESEEGRKGHVRSDMGFMMIRRRMDGQGGPKLKKKAKAKAKKGNTSCALVILSTLLISLSFRSRRLRGR